ncbi:hypothetical protein Nmel_007828 [Mimus melanotis]
MNGDFPSNPRGVTDIPADSQSSLPVFLFHSPQLFPFVLQLFAPFPSHELSSAGCQKVLVHLAGVPEGTGRLSPYLLLWVWSCRHAGSWENHAGKGAGVQSRAELCQRGGPGQGRRAVRRL